jgi:hypothetical protein
LGQHDRDWTEREVFGKVRYMSAGSLEHKGKPEAYVEKVVRLIEGPERAPGSPSVRVSVEFRAIHRVEGVRLPWAIHGEYEGQVRESLVEAGSPVHHHVIYVVAA